MSAHHMFTLSVGIDGSGQSYAELYDNEEYFSAMPVATGTGATPDAAVRALLDVATFDSIAEEVTA